MKNKMRSKKTYLVWLSCFPVQCLEESKGITTKICRLCFCPKNSIRLNLLCVRFCFRMLAVILVSDLFIFYTQSPAIPYKCASVTQGVLACNRHMLENQLACDIWFSVGVNQEKIGAHRYVLQSRSGVFFAMLDGPGADRSHMDLPNAQPKAFWQLLRLVATLNFVLLCLSLSVCVF